MATNEELWDIDLRLANLTRNMRITSFRTPLTVLRFCHLRRMELKYKCVRLILQDRGVL